MSEKIPVNENMPDDLKIAINYLNESNISLTDKIDIDEEVEILDSDDDFIGGISEDEINDTLDSIGEDELEENTNVDMSDLDSIF